MLWRSPTSAADPQRSGKCACQQDRRNRPTDEFHSLSMFDRTPNRNVSVLRVGNTTTRPARVGAGVRAVLTYLAIGLGSDATDQQRSLRWLTRSSTQCHGRFTTDRSTPSSRSPLRPPWTHGTHPHMTPGGPLPWHNDLSATPFCPLRHVTDRSGIAPGHTRKPKTRPRRVSFAGWGYLESNQGPHPYQGCALTD